MAPEPSPSLPPLPVATSDRALMILCHLSAILGVGLILPFIVWLVKRRDPDAVSVHAMEAFNFHLTLVIYGLVCVPLSFVFGIGVVLALVVAAAGVVLAIIAAVRASEGKFFRYPLTIRLVT
jgi:uncharacterized protein